MSGKLIIERWKRGHLIATNMPSLRTREHGQIKTMKILFKNIGPVGKAELELKDLTIIAGPNNTGKTYLAYTLYGFFRLVRQPLFLRHKIKDLPFDVSKTAQKILDTGTAHIPVKDFDKVAKKVVRQMFCISGETISDIFSSPPDDFKDAEFSFYPDDSLQDESDIRMTSLSKKEGKIAAGIDKETLSFHLLGDLSSVPPGIAEEMLFSVFISMCMGLFNLPKPFILCAERFGISLFYKELDFSKNRLVEIIQKLQDKGDTRNVDLVFSLTDQISSHYAQPIKDNIDYTRELEFIQKQPLIRVGKIALANTDGRNLPDNIKEMLGGYFKYRDGGIRFVSKARKNGKFDIPLHLASSSARGLSDLYFFLKHTAHKNHLLIIDEPESHLNTANQIEIARLLARCVNRGLKVLITTHSDYLIKEFNNLIMLNNNFKGKANFLKSNKQYSPNDCLKPEAVGAYICENGTLTPCRIDNKGMDIQSFDNTIDEINRISDELDFLTDSLPVE